ncbi:uncharacterized protein LOC126679435 [Mercurialis annua]|uniref:uncharacterized protein LOC126679435 n=1 Tax=Mercurialis annua TaxID=3986 RepID=UPI002160F154|nr:uncharacterized protein LOC126679435 [Mercurialis annua]
MANNNNIKTITDLFDAYFKRADLDGDGQISGAEAVAFFQGSGLPKQVLAQVWTYADQRKAGFLSRQEFYNALKLITVAQSKRDLTPEMVKAALYSNASASIPAPQINLAATPAPRPAMPAPAQIAGSTSMVPQNVGIRPPQVPGNASTNQQYFPTQQNQFMRPPHGMPVNSLPNPQQIPASQGMARGSNMTAPRPPIPNVPTGGNMSITNTQNQTAGVSTHVTRDGFGLMASGVTRSAQPRPQVITGQTSSSTPNVQEAGAPSNQLATKDSKVSGNGFASDSFFGDVFAVSPAQPTQNSSSGALSANVLPVSSAMVTSSVGSQSPVNPKPLDTLQSAFSQLSAGGQPAARTSSVTPGPGYSVGTGNSASNQSQPPWPKMTHSDIQRYIKVFVEVDTDRDGKISGEQARNLFLSWRLPREVLKQVWDLSDQDNDSMLSLREFCIALYLMEHSRGTRALPATLPNSVMAIDALLSTTGHPTASHGSGAWGSASVLRPPAVPAPRQLQAVPGPRQTPAAAARPPRPPSHADERQPNQQKPKVPVLEKHLVDQLSQEEQDSLKSKFEEAAQADKKVEELEKEIADSRQKIEFYRVKMQELIFYKSRCDNRLNEVSERVIADKREVEALGKKYEEKYKQTGDVASKLTIEEATFRDFQERKMDLYRTIVKMEEGGTDDGVLKERAERIQSSLEELVKNVNERCKQYGLRAKPISLVELPFGWQPGIQEGTADWDEDWDKLEDEGFVFVKELTLDVQNVVAPPKPKPSVQKAISTNEDSGSSPSKTPEKSDTISGSSEPIHEKESPRNRSENGVARSPPESPAGRIAMESQSRDFRDSPSRAGSGADGSPHAKEIKSDMGGNESANSGDRIGDLPAWGTFDQQYDTESNWGADSVSGKELDHDRLGGSSLFGMGDFSINPIRTGPSRADNLHQGKGTSLFADSVPSTPAGRSLFADSVPSTPVYNQGRGLFADSVPGTPAYNQGRGVFADSVPSTPAYAQGKNSSFGFADSVPGTPAYNFGNSPRRFSEGSEDYNFDSFSRFDSFNLPDSGSFQTTQNSLGRFDSMRSTRDSEQGYGFPSRFDSFSESRDSDQNQGFSRFDSFRDSDPGQGFSRFDSFRDTDQSQGFSRFDSFRDSEQSHGFSRFDSFRDTDHSQGLPSRFDSFRESDNSHGFMSRFDSFNANDSGFSENSFATSDSVRGPNDHDNSHASLSFDETDPFGSTGPFRTSAGSETPKSSDNWKAF